jgi:hypothetical protein
VDKSTWNHLLTAAAVLIPIVAILALAKARPRRQVVAPFLPILVVSIFIYLTTGSGASDFHRAAVVCAALALGFAFVLTRFETERDKLATYSWALLGVVTPYLFFFTLLTAVCWGQTECF